MVQISYSTRGKGFGKVLKVNCELYRKLCKNKNKATIESIIEQYVQTEHHRTGLVTVIYVQM